MPCASPHDDVDSVDCGELYILSRSSISILIYAKRKRENSEIVEESAATTTTLSTKKKNEKDVSLLKENKLK